MSHYMFVNLLAIVFALLVGWFASSERRDVYKAMTATVLLLTTALIVTAFGWRLWLLTSVGTILGSIFALWRFSPSKGSIAVRIALCIAVSLFTASLMAKFIVWSENWRP